MNKIFNHLKTHKDTQLLIVADEKEATVARDCASFLGYEPFVLSDLRANYGEDLLSFSDELRELTSTLQSYHKYKKKQKKQNKIIFHLYQ